jgi:hypothetical protein
MKMSLNWWIEQLIMPLLVLICAGVATPVARSSVKLLEVERI